MDEMKTIGAPDSGAAEAALAAVAGVLEVLWRACAAADKPVSLARLARQSQRPMSVLMRQLTFLAEAGWVEPAARAQGGQAVRLSAAGARTCAELFGGAGDAV